MKQKDSRIKLMSEILNGIKVSRSIVHWHLEQWHLGQWSLSAEPERLKISFRMHQHLSFRWCIFCKNVDNN